MYLFYFILVTYNINIIQLYFNFNQFQIQFQFQSIQCSYNLFLTSQSIYPLIQLIHCIHSMIIIYTINDTYISYN